MPGRRPGTRGHAESNYGAALTWESIPKLMELAGVPFMIKGIVHPDDARRAAALGVAAVWVSNHGGRQLDQSVATLDMLPRIVEAVGGRCAVIFDGGILRGTDVLKALALGADAVAIGKLQGWGMAAGGVEGLVKTLELLEAEIRMAMALIGVTSIAQLEPSLVEPASPVFTPHEMSMWVDLAEHRLT
jgi:isopentenyl diphosphate isomerase/L-lactate dehydrogenase-like FMN-dependent dehydrogenase